MALQNSGTIKLDQVGKEFAGPTPYKLQDHYRGGGRVPTTIPGNTKPGNPGNYTPGTPGGCVGSGPWTYQGVCPEIGTSDCDNAPSGWSLGGRRFGCPDGTVVMMNGACGGANLMQSQCHAQWFGRDVQPGRINGVSTRNVTENNPNPPSYNPPNPPTTNPAVPINTEVPSSGTIKLSNFYGSRRT